MEDAKLILGSAKMQANGVLNEGVLHQKSLTSRQESSDSIDGIAGNEPPDIRSLSYMLTEVYNWEVLGIHLGIKMHKLEEIKGKCQGDLEMCKNRLYDTWLRQNTDASWKEIVQALKLMEERNIADKIKHLPFFEEDQTSSLPDMRQYNFEIVSSYSSNTQRQISGARSVETDAIIPTTTTFPALVPNSPTSIRAPCSYHSSVITPQATSCATPHSVVHSAKAKNDESLVSLLKSITIEDPQQIEIICRVYNANTNALIQSTSAPLTRDIRLSRRSRLQEFSSEQVTLGASIRLEVTADSNCFLYILNIGTSGNTTLLLPNEYERNNQFSANQTYYLPDKDYGFEISGPPGKETIQIMAFSNRLDMLDKMAVTTVQEREIYRDITIRRKKRIADTTEKKGYAQIQFSVT